MTDAVADALMLCDARVDLLLDACRAAREVLTPDAWDLEARDRVLLRIDAAIACATDVGLPVVVGTAR